VVFYASALTALLMLGALLFACIAIFPAVTVAQTPLKRRPDPTCLSQM